MDELYQQYRELCEQLETIEESITAEEGKVVQIKIQIDQLQIEWNVKRKELVRQCRWIVHFQSRSTKDSFTLRHLILTRVDNESRKQSVTSITSRLSRYKKWTDLAREKCKRLKYQIAINELKKRSMKNEHRDHLLLY